MKIQSQPEMRISDKMFKNHSFKTANNAESHLVNLGDNSMNKTWNMHRNRNL